MSRNIIRLKRPLAEGAEINGVLPNTLEELDEALRQLGAYRATVSRPNSTKRRKRIRALLRRDGAKCVYCGRSFGTGLPFSRPTIDHVVPVVRGGSNALTNLVLACKPCNLAKADQVWEGGGE